MIATYNHRVLSRIEKAINIDTLTIPFMHECQRIYEEIKNTTGNSTENITEFIYRLEMFIHRVAEHCERTLDSCVDQLGAENIKNFNEAIHYYLSFRRFIPPQDVTRYGITFFDKLIAVITQMYTEVLRAIEILLRSLEERVEQRNFDNIDQELNRIQKIVKKMMDYLGESRQKEPSESESADP
jgi:hypothetical protein